MIFHFSNSSCERLILSVTFLSVLGSARLPAEESVVSKAKGFFEKAISAAKGAVSKNDAPGPAEESEGETEEDAQSRVLREAAETIFHEDGGFHFTQSRWGASPTPFQLDGLEFVPLEETPTNIADARNGIDRRVTYEIRVKQHRRFHEQTGWGRWTPGLPPHLETFVLIRENGVWKAAVTPGWAYSIK